MIWRENSKRSQLFAFPPRINLTHTIAYTINFWTDFELDIYTKLITVQKENLIF